MIEVGIGGVFLPQPQAFQYREIARKANGDRGEDDVARHRESELDPREVQCGQAKHDSSLSLTPVAASGSALHRRPAVSFIRVGAGDLLLQPNTVVLLGPSDGIRRAPQRVTWAGRQRLARRQESLGKDRAWSWLPHSF